MPLSVSVRRRTALLLAATAAAWLTLACGGGGDAPEVPATQASTFAPSASLAGLCTLADEQRFARSHLDEIYLWWNEIVEVDAAQHGSVAAYFDALRVRARDSYSAVLTSTAADTLLQGAASPAGALVSTSVPLAKVVTSGGGRRVGYLLFNDHRSGAQDALIAAVETLRDAGVQDLVMDLRYNSGGYLYVAQAAASMVAAPQPASTVFERLAYNDKRAARGEGSTLAFISQVQVAETVHRAGDALPHLSLPRLYVLASGMTCSASESIVNGLRGIGVEVVIVGETTCGKPYGFRRRDNCGLAYFAVEFQGYNARDFGDYLGGFAPQCRMTDDPRLALGSPQEALLATALHHADTGACPDTDGDPAARSVLSVKAATVRPAATPSASGLAGRMLLEAAP